jgi:ABC-type phosphate/phosphonate transport system substrate-binding protein
MRPAFMALIISIFLQVSLLPGTCLPVPGNPEFYYFNPDSAQSNMGRLKLEMDTFFNKSGYKVSFQAFSYQTDFDVKIREQRPQFLFAPEWYIKKYGRKMKIKPFLVPVYKGMTTYHKVLLVAKNSPITLDAIATHSLAMTSMGPDSEPLLKQIFFSGSKKSFSFRPVIVPKTTDALFALFLGHVESALVIKEHFENLEKMLPGIIDGVRPLAVSKPIPTPMLCYMEELVEQSDVEKFKRVFLSEDNKAAQKKLLQLLQIDGWREIAK